MIQSFIPNCELRTDDIQKMLIRVKSIIFHFAFFSFFFFNSLDNRRHLIDYSTELFQKNMCNSKNLKIYFEMGSGKCQKMKGRLGESNSHPSNCS